MTALPLGRKSLTTSVVLAVTLPLNLIGQTGIAFRPHLSVPSMHVNKIISVAFSANGDLFASASTDSSIKIWSMRDQTMLRTIYVNDIPDCIAFSPTDSSVIAVSSENGITFYDSKNGEITRIINIDGRPKVLTFSPDGRTIIAGIMASAEKKKPAKEAFHEIKVIDVETVHLAYACTLPPGILPVLCVSPLGKIFAAKLNNQDVALVDYEAGIQRRVLKAPDTRALAFNRTGTIMAVLSDSVRLIGVTSGNEERILRWSYKQEPLAPFPMGAALPPERKHLTLNSIAFSTDNKFLAIGGTGVFYWDLVKGNAFGPLWAGSSGGQITFQPGSHLLASATGTRRTGDPNPPKLWTLPDGEPVAMQAQKLAQVRGISFSKDERMLAAARGDAVEVWDLERGTVILHEEQPEVNAVAFDDSRRFLISGGDHYKSPRATLRLWEISSRTFLNITRIPQDALMDRYLPDVLAISSLPGGDRVLLGGRRGDSLSVYDFQTKRFTNFDAGGRTITAVAPSNDGAFFVSGSAAQKYDSDPVPSVQFWRLGSSAAVPLYEGDAESAGITAVAIDTERQRVAAGDEAGRTLVWDSGSRSKIFESHLSDVPIRSLLFDATTGNLLLGRDDGTLAIYPKSLLGEPVVTLAHGTGLRALVSAPSQNVLATGGDDGNMILWRLSGLVPHELCRLYLSSSGWTVVDPDGRFDTGEPDEIMGLRWIFPDDPLRALGPEVFMRDYYEPRLLPRLLAGESLREVRPLQDLNRAQPKLEILRVTPSSEPAKVAVEIAADGATYTFRRGSNDVKMETGVYDLRLFRNGQLVRQWPEAQEDASVTPEGNSQEQLKAWREATAVRYDGRKKNIEFKGVRLPRGSGNETVEFSAYAFNADRVKSATAKRVYKSMGAVAATKPKAYLVCVGVTSYESANWNLVFAGEDARQMEQTLRPRLERAGYKVDCKLLISEGMQQKDWLATKNNVKASLTEIASQATPDDLVLVSFSGHGYTDKNNEFYLLLSDIGEGQRRDEEPSSQLLQRCVSGEELSRWMRKIDAGEMILVIDACHSAAVVEQPWFKPGPMGSRGLGQLAYDKRMRVLAASQADDFAIEAGELRQGLLTYALTKDGLEAKEADFQPKDGKITLGEWLAYGAERVPQLHEKIRKREPIIGAAPQQKDSQAKGILLVDENKSTIPSQTLTRNVTPIAPTEQSLHESSLPKKHAFQTPQLFDYSRSGVNEVILDNMAKTELGKKIGSK